jgi:hypothetical protein
MALERDDPTMQWAIAAAANAERRKRQERFLSEATPVVLSFGRLDDDGAAAPGDGGTLEERAARAAAFLEGKDT